MNLNIFCKSAPLIAEVAEFAALLREPNIVLKFCFQGGYLVCSNGKVIGVCWTNIQMNSTTYYSVLLFLITIIQPNSKCMTLLISIYVAFSKAPSRQMFLNVLFLWKNINNTQFPQPKFVNLHSM